jgi:predicted amidohydrolase
VSLRVAIAQTEVRAEVPTADVVRAARDQVLAQIAQAADAGARMVGFPEGTLAYPSKRAMSRLAPELGEADWSRTDWAAIARAVDAIRQEAARRRIWVVVGAPHELSAGHRPHNSLYVISDAGDIVSRYDKRFLSTNEAAYLYTPGTDPVIVEIDGVRIGFALCLEVLFPEVFVEYAELGADLVHLASAPDPNFAMLAQAYALITGLHVSVAFGAGDQRSGPSGICSMLGWLVTTAGATPDVVVADVAPTRNTHTFQQRARSGELYAGLLAPDDPRSRDRTLPPAAPPAG